MINFGRFAGSCEATSQQGGRVTQGMMFNNVYRGKKDGSNIVSPGARENDRGQNKKTANIVYLQEINI